MADKVKLINSFFGGIVRDDKSRIAGAHFNIEEVDIWSNQDYVQAEQIMSADTLPSGSEIYAYDVGEDDILYAYGKETATNKVRLFSVADGGSDNPGDFTTLFTSADTTNLATALSDIKFHRTSETGGGKFLYYVAGAGSSWVLKRYDITAATESTVGNLSGFISSFRPAMKRFFGELYICHGQYVAKVDDDGVFVEKAFTLPNSQVAIDIIPVSDVAIILARNINRKVNETMGYWWDLESATQFDDQFRIPMGGGQWIVNWKEKIIVFCAINGVGKFYVLSGAFPGAQPLEMPGRLLTNLAAETSTQPISSPKMVAQKDGILYFGLYKTDKTGIYALGQIDANAPIALILSKRFSTTDYANHKPIALLIHGPNFYGAYNDTAGNLISRCESNNSPARSSNAVIETLWIDFDAPLQKKNLTRAYLTSYPLPSGTSLSLSVASDYSSSYTAVKRADNSVFNSANGLLGLFRPAAFQNKMVFRAKVSFTSSGTNSPKLTGIGLRAQIKPIE
jgi:hypothetical protein